MDRSVAVAQTVPVRGHLDRNMDEHIELVQVAAEEGAEVLVFPELSLTGYELDLAEATAFSEDDRRLAPLVEEAASCSMTVVAGAPVRLGSHLHIAAFIISSDRMVSVYTKQHLGAFSPAAACDGVVPPAEAVFFQPGDRNPLVRVGGTIAAVAVCADTGRPSHALEAADRGATIYLASMFVIPSELDRETANLQACSVRHSMAVAFANYGGPSGGLASAGRSAIWSETGELLVELDPAGTGVAVATKSQSGWRAKKIAVSSVRTS